MESKPDRSKADAQEVAKELVAKAAPPVTEQPPHGAQSDDHAAQGPWLCAQLANTRNGL
jgi:hypothetical protein